MTTARLALLGMALVAMGCSSDEKKTGQGEAPRPVSVITLETIDPTQSQRTGGAVASWKIEDIGFEVGGRLEFVVEPETDVTGYIGENAKDGTILAKLDTSRYEIDVESANAQIDTLSRQKDAAVVQAEEVIPAEMEAANADLAFAQFEFSRNQKLLEQNAIVKAQLDQVQAQLKSAQAKVKQVEANQKAKRAEVTSYEAKIKQAEAQLKESERNLANCVLRAPFRSQIAQVHVIPGGVVQQGQPVVTVQMMDPIKVEFEVSAEKARRLRHKDEIGVLVTRPDGGTLTEDGIVYMTDTTADPATRTFTITVLVRNRKLSLPVPDEVADKQLPRTQDIWRMLKGIVDDSDRYYLAKEAIRTDADGNAYFWRITEDSRRDGVSDFAPVFTVEKVQITIGQREGTFLGLWPFQEVSVVEGQEFNPEKDLIAGKLIMAGDSGWDGGQIVYEQTQWMLRPGDLVGVSSAGEEQQPGLYVPMSAIKSETDQKFVFVVDDGKLRKQAVKTHASIGTRIRVTPIDGELSDGAKIVSGRVHYLVDGEQVVIAEELDQ